MKKFEEVSIPGVPGYFQVVQLPATRAYYLLLDIISIVVPSAAKGLGGGSMSLGDVDLAQLAEGLQGFFDRATRAKVEAVTKELFSTIEHFTDSKHTLSQGYLDELFQGNVLGLFLLQKEALRVNYASFFSALAPQLKGLVAKATNKAQGGSKSGSSAGPSGASSSSSASQP